MPEPKDPTPRDFKYGHLLTGELQWKKVIPSIKTEFLRPWLQIFSEQINRTSNLAVMPAMIAAHVRRDQVFQSNAIYQYTGQGIITLDELLQIRFTTEMEQHTRLQLAAFNVREDRIDDLARGEFGRGFVEWHLEGNKGMQIGMDAIFASIVIESWTAFESLASDVWVTTIDQGPKSLANKIALYKDFKQREPITVKMIRDLEYDARKELGKFLRETERVQFSTLEGIKNAYEIAFGKEAWQLFDATNDGYINALSAFRNIFAHKLGRADKKFVVRVQRFEEFKNIKSEDIVELNGELVRKLRDASVLMGFSLVKFVDDFIFAAQE